MTKVILLEELKKFCENAVKDYRLPTTVQKGDTERICRPPKIYRMRLPDSGAADKIVPYIILQVVTGKDEQKEGEYPEASAVVRLIFAVYNEDEQEGALSLLNVMETVRIAFLKAPALSDMFCLDRAEGVEMLVYPDNKAPYFVGEMLTVWELPPVEQEACPWEDMKGVLSNEKEINGGGKY